MSKIFPESKSDLLTSSKASVIFEIVTLILEDNDVFSSSHEENLMIDDKHKKEHRMLFNELYDTIYSLIKNQDYLNSLRK